MSTKIASPKVAPIKPAIQKDTIVNLGPGQGFVSKNFAFTAGGDVAATPKGAEPTDGQHDGAGSFGAQAVKSQPNKGAATTSKGIDSAI